MRRTRVRWLALHLVGVGLVAGCGDSMQPEQPPDPPDLGVAEFAVVQGLELRAKFEVIQEDPSTHLWVSLSATNRTDQRIDFTAGSPCFATPFVYAWRADRWVQYGGGASAIQVCPQVLLRLPVLPGQTQTLPAGPPFAVADWVGAEFQPGTYVVTAALPGLRDDEGREVELLAGRVDAK